MQQFTGFILETKYYIIMKKLGLLFLALIFAFLQSSAYDFMVDGLCYNFNDDGTSVTVTNENSNSSSPSYSNLSGDLTIPSSVSYAGTTYSVTSIGENAFWGCRGMTSVTIPNSVNLLAILPFLIAQA